MTIRTRSLGLGSTELINGTDMYGYYGKYQGIITPNELISMTGITQGGTKNDGYNNPNEDITWLKFSHNYKTLFVADRTIHASVSWDHLNERGLVFGKVVDIDGQKYLLRLLQGANVNPASVSGGEESNDEWESLIVKFVPSQEDSNWGVIASANGGSGGANTLCQETLSSDIDSCVSRGGLTNVTDFETTIEKSSNTFGRGYRPVLEVL